MNHHYQEAEDLISYTIFMLKRFLSEDITTFHPSVLDTSIMKLINAKCELSKGDCK